MSESGTADQSLIPPVEALFDGSSSTEEFLWLGEGFVRQVLIPRAGLQPHDRFLDLGCGNGAVARALVNHLSPGGRYDGIDVNASSVEWLQAHYRDYTNFRFAHAAVYNKMYNPAAPQAASSYCLPYSDGNFSIVLLKSVFTHMLPGDMRHYLSEVGRVLSPGGRAVITYFLLNGESRRHLAVGSGSINVPFEHEGDPLCRVANREVPEQAVAHDEARVRAHTADAGLSVCELSFGNWCGRPSLLGLQDLVIAVKV
jgi:SAM-dependent methyltransferase